MPAGTHRIDRDLVARAKGLDACADGLHDAAKFMPKDHAASGKWMGAGDDFEVGRANACGSNSDQYIDISLDFRRRTIGQ